MTTTAITQLPALRAVGETLPKAEACILEALGGTPWQLDRLTPEATKEALADWRRLRAAAGFSSAGGWFTTERMNPKLAKSGLPTGGVTLLAAAGASTAWGRLSPESQERIAGALDTTVEDVTRRLWVTVCPFATPACTGGCVVDKSNNAQIGRTGVSRLTRTLFHLFRPDLAFTLTGTHLAKMYAKHGGDCRWRVNIADDIRWEHLAPGLFELGVPGYAYTKWPVNQRPGFGGFSVVYSATERTTVPEIVELAGAGERVAVVFAVRAKDLPTEWNGVPVSNGNETDDLFEHPAGTIVGLSVKAPTREMKMRMALSGFAKAA